MKRLVLIFSFSSLFATLNEPLKVELFTNYRNDRIHWHLQEPQEPSTLTYSEIYKDIEFWENGLTFKAIHRDLTFFLRGSYGTFGKGRGIQKIPKSRFSTHGWCADAVGYFGYAVNLTDGRVYKVILTPLIGYSGYFEELKPKTFRFAWNGFFFGGTFAIVPSGPISLFFGYSYHLLHNRLHANAPSVRANAHGNGQSGWAQMDWTLNEYWKVGFNGLIHYFSTHVVNAKVRQEGGGDFSEKLKLRWTVISAGAQISRQF